MANNKSILINYGSEAITNDASGFVPGKTATLYTKGHLLENDITVAFPEDYVIPEGSMDIKENGTGINVAGKATVNVQVPAGPDLSKATGSDGASEADVLKGKWFYGKDGMKEGTLPLSDADAYATEVLAGRTFYGKNGMTEGTLPLLQDHTFTLVHDDERDLDHYILVPEEDTYNYFALEIGDSGHVKHEIYVSLKDLAWDKSFILN
jgi:hypothetical protein